MTFLECLQLTALIRLLAGNPISHVCAYDCMGLPDVHTYTCTCTCTYTCILEEITSDLRKDSHDPMHGTS